MWVKTVPLLALAMYVVLHGVPCDGAASQQPVTFEKEDIRFSSKTAPQVPMDEFIQDDTLSWGSADCSSSSCGGEWIEFTLDPPKVIARVTYRLPHPTGIPLKEDPKEMIIHGSTSADCSERVELIQIPDARSKTTWDIPEDKRKKFGCLRLDIKSNNGAKKVVLRQFLIYEEVPEINLLPVDLKNEEVSASVDAIVNQGPEKTIDNDDSTWWESEAAAQPEIKFVFAAAKRIGKVGAGRTDNEPGAIDILGSTTENCDNEVTLVTDAEFTDKSAEWDIPTDKRGEYSCVKLKIKSMKTADQKVQLTSVSMWEEGWTDSKVNDYDCSIRGDTQKCPCPANTVTWFSDNNENVCGCKENNEDKMCRPGQSTSDDDSCSTFKCKDPVYDEMECVINEDNKNVFSVIIQGTDIQVDNMKVKFKENEDDAEKSGDCPAGRIKIQYIRQSEMTSDPREIHSKLPTELKAADEKGTVDKNGNTVAAADFTRIQFTIKDCSFRTESTEVPPTYQYSAQLQIGFTSWVVSTIFNLRCDFSQETTTDDLEIGTTLEQAESVDDDARVEAELKIQVYDEATTQFKDPEKNSQTDKMEVKLGQTLQLQAKVKGDLELDSAFKFCKVCDTPDCSGANSQDLLEEKTDNKLNCVQGILKGTSRFIVKPAKVGTTYSTFEFPAFRFADSIVESLFLRCQLAICKQEDDSQCRKICGEDYVEGRRRRSVEDAQIEPIYASTAVAIEVVMPSALRCPSSKTLRGTSRLSCTNGTNVGSICRQDCARGFAGDAKGQKTSLKICQEEVTDSIGSLYFGMAPAWSPSSSRCYDVNECLENPCPSQSLCRNTVGSFYCKKQY